MRKAREKKNVAVNIFSNNHCTFNFDGKTKASVYIIIVIILAVTLLVMSFSKIDELINWLCFSLSLTC